MPTSAMYRALAIAAIGARLLAKMAAVAESAATTRCRDDPNTAKATAGSSSV